MFVRCAERAVTVGVKCGGALGLHGSGETVLEDGLALGVGKDIMARIDERSDKGYATQVYYCMSIGATRMEEEKVVQIICDESA